jgi:hypothetical protein
VRRSVLASSFQAERWVTSSTNEREVRLSYSHSLKGFADDRLFGSSHNQRRLSFAFYFDKSCASSKTSRGAKLFAGCAVCRVSVCVCDQFDSRFEGRMLSRVHCFLGFSLANAAFALLTADDFSSKLHWDAKCTSILQHHPTVHLSLHQHTAR